MSTILYNAIQTPDGTILHSKHRWDYVSHLDTVSGELYATDGGNDYTRRSVNAERYIDLTVTTDDPFEAQREVFTWKSYGINGEIPEGVFTALKDLTDEHISAILLTQRRIKGTYVERLFLQERGYRIDVALGLIK